ncbi:TFIIB-type zinc ribbon-containing protein [Paenibacillus sp. MBLB2552]|uniref:TFIIB-type zinc ribbon-containing protein n=1 Tax=Paenibacillus mellifer TaxID=2937794 RepID=A0A9X1Y3I4_9BACL|nr:TFIIB-type zinc ribbon-containing protein [Paenibacillus mellifer]MCK8489898.1 TFIIB-type zinc ribbon-containing protein [Paenibacillus mellifer]
MPVIEYKCPSCGSGMTFDSTTGMLSCPSCGRKDNIEQIPDPLKQQVFAEDEVREYHCESCGAVIVTEPETSATTCSFCGSAVVLSDRLTGKLAPQQVIPFAISKEEAVAAFKKWCRKGLLTPRGFMTADRIQNITGMYVPFWLYDLLSNVDVRGQGTQVRSYRRGDYQYTETDYYEFYRKIRLHYVRLPIDASAKMDDQLMDKLEPFPYEQLKTFKTPYLAGYIAEKYNYNSEKLTPRAREKTMPYIESYISSTVNEYATVSYAEKQIDTTVKQAHYTLLPVWMVYYNYKGKQYTFAMNGQTGKVVGKPPLSKGKITAWFAGVSALSFLGLKIVAWMLGGGFI